MKGCTYFKIFNFNFQNVIISKMWNKFQLYKVLEAKKDEICDDSRTLTQNIEHEYKLNIHVVSVSEHPCLFRYSDIREPIHRFPDKRPLLLEGSIH